MAPNHLLVCSATGAGRRVITLGMIGRDLAIHSEMIQRERVVGCGRLTIALPKAYLWHINFWFWLVAQETCGKHKKPNLQAILSSQARNFGLSWIQLGVMEVWDREKAIPYPYQALALKQLYMKALLGPRFISLGINWHVLYNLPPPIHSFIPSLFPTSHTLADRLLGHHLPLLHIFPVQVTKHTHLVVIWRLRYYLP